MSRPNILFIFTDQQRGDTIHAAGNPVMKTPHLDRIAREGVIFSSAYTASPVCVSARCSLILGQYPHKTGCADNGHRMPEDRPTFMQALSDIGYRTHGIGKMHFNPDPQGLRGFQTREHQAEMRHRVEDDDYLTFLHANGYEHVYDPFGPRGEMYYIPQPAQMPAKFHGTNWVGDRAVQFIHEAETSRPFCLWASFIHPHPPFSPPTPWNKLYRGPLMPLPKRPDNCEALQTYMNRYQNRYKYRDNGIDNNLLRVMKAYYYGCISFIDFQVGRMLKALEETNQLDNTLIVYTSDHGELLGDYNCFGKRSMPNSAARIPMIARYPERIASGKKINTPTNLVDVMPTLLAAAGIDTAAYDLDGIDLADIASNEQSDAYRSRSRRTRSLGDFGYDRTVYSQFQRDALGVYMATNSRWKYFYSAPDRREFLFDRINDPDEMRNRAGLSFCRNALEQMRNNLFEFYRSEDFTDPIEENRWKLFPQPSIPDDPDEGLLIQDPGWSMPYQTIEGYTD